MVFDDLSVRISAETINFSRKISGAQEDLGDLTQQSLETASGLQVLQGRADEAGDEIGQAGRRAGTTSGAFSTLTFSSHGLSFGLGGVTRSATLAGLALGGLTVAATALVSTLFPLAAVLGTIAAAAGGLAGAFGLIIGTGIVAYNEELKEEGSSLMEVLADTKDELIDIIAPFGKQFIPLIVDAIDALPDLVENILNAVGGVDSFVDALRDMGRMAFRAIPDMVAMFMDLGRMALPIFMDGLRWLQQNGADIFWSMVRVTKQLAPVLMNLVSSFINAIPELTKLGTVVLQTLVPAFTGFIQTVEDIINLAESEGGIVDFIKALVNDAVNWVTGEGVETIKSLGGDILTGITNALNPAGEGEDGGGFTDSLIGRIKDLLDSTVAWLTEGNGTTEISNFVNSLLGSIKSQLDQISKEDISSIIESLTSIIGSVFDALITSAQSDEAAALGGRIGELANQLMAQLGSRMFDYVTSEAFISDMARVAVAVTNVLGAALSEAFSTKPLVNAVFGEGTFQNAPEFRGNMQLAGAGGGGGGAQNTNIEIEVSGDSEIVEDITARVVNDRERRTNRQTGRSSNLGR